MGGLRRLAELPWRWVLSATLTVLDGPTLAEALSGDVMGLKWFLVDDKKCEVCGLTLD